MSVARDVAAFIEAQGIATFAANTGWTIAVSREALSPPECITVYDVPGGEPDTDESDIQSTFQVRVRASAYEDASAKAVAVRDALIHASRPVMNGVQYSYVFNTISISSLGRDDSDRFLLVATYKTLLERSP